MNGGRLDLALAFLNSRDELRDWLSSPDRAGRWLQGAAFVGVDAGLGRLLPAITHLAGPSAPAPADVARARRVRDGLLRWIDGELLDPATVDGLLFAPDHSASGPALIGRAGGILALAAHAFLVLAELDAAGDRARLRRCRSDDCRWVFFDRSRNRSKVWCDMVGCGSRAKARAYRARRAPGTR